jgi:hypothetical protein
MITSPGKLKAGIARSWAFLFWFIQDMTITGGATSRTKANVSIRLFGIQDQAVVGEPFQCCKPSGIL